MPGVFMDGDHRAGFRIGGGCGQRWSVRTSDFASVRKGAVDKLGEGKEGPARLGIPVTNGLAMVGRMKNVRRCRRGGKSASHKQDRQRQPALVMRRVSASGEPPYSKERVSMRTRARRP